MEKGGRNQGDRWPQEAEKGKKSPQILRKKPALLALLLQLTESDFGL